MKKIAITAMALVVGGMMTSAMAGGGAACGASCGDKVVKQEAAAPCNASCLDKIELTEAQQTKMAALKTECEGISCDVTSAKKMRKGMEKILTKEQMAKAKAACAAGNCRKSCETSTTG